MNNLKPSFDSRVWDFFKEGKIGLEVGNVCWSEVFAWLYNAVTISSKVQRVSLALVLTVYGQMTS